FERAKRDVARAAVAPDDRPGTQRSVRDGLALAQGVDSASTFQFLGHTKPPGSLGKLAMFAAHSQCVVELRYTSRTSCCPRAVGRLPFQLRATQHTPGAVLALRASGRTPNCLARRR